MGLWARIRMLAARPHRRHFPAQYDPESDAVILGLSPQLKGYIRA